MIPRNHNSSVLVYNLAFCSCSKNISCLMIETKWQGIHFFNNLGKKNHGWKTMTRISQLFLRLGQSTGRKETLVQILALLSKTSVWRQRIQGQPLAWLCSYLCTVRYQLNCLTFQYKLSYLQRGIWWSSSHQEAFIKRLLSCAPVRGPISRCLPIRDVVKIYEITKGKLLISLEEWNRAKPKDSEFKDS